MSTSISVKELDELFGIPSTARSKDFWLIELGEDDSVHIDDVLSSATRFFSEHIEAIRSIKGRCEVELRIGWTPTSGLAGIAFERDLIGLLAEAGADLLLDVYDE